MTENGFHHTHTENTNIFTLVLTYMYVRICVNIEIPQTAVLDMIGVMWIYWYG